MPLSNLITSICPVLSALMSVATMGAVLINPLINQSTNNSIKTNKTKQKSKLQSLIWRRLNKHNSELSMDAVHRCRDIGFSNNLEGFGLDNKHPGKPVPLDWHIRRLGHNIVRLRPQSIVNR